MRTLTPVTMLCATVWLSACAAFPQERYAGPVVAVPADAVARCALIDKLHSSSGLVGFFGPKGVDNIKQNLLKQADALGATHVVWGEPSVGYDSTSLSGQAYRCPPSDIPR